MTCDALNSDLALRIEIYLLAHGGWVTAHELGQQFRVTDRAFRQSGQRPGLLTEFTISSSTLGFKHVSRATTAEWIRAKNTIRREALARLRRVRILRSRRDDSATIDGCRVAQIDSGQFLLNL